MKTILLGSIAFLVWSSMSTYYYVCNIEGLCMDDQAQISELYDGQTSEKARILEPEKMSEPEVKISSPETFIVHHQYNHQEFIKSARLEEYLTAVKAFIDTSPDARVSIVGNTDDVGPEDYNTELGLKRASYLKEYLVSHGLADSSIAISSDGETSPITSNASKSGRAENRRSEITIKTN